jgi:hypothetical protein
MPLPWLRILDGVLGATDVVRLVRGRPAGENEETRPARVEGFESKLTGVMMAALKEVFDRDSERLDLERQQAEENRRRADRALRLEVLRQAGEREIGRLRVLTIVAIVGLAGTVMLAARLSEHAPLARTMFGLGAVALLLALAGSLSAQARVSRSLGYGDERATVEEVTASLGGAIALWACVVAIAFALVGVLLG